MATVAEMQNQITQLTAAVQGLLAQNAAAAAAVPTPAPPPGMMYPGYSPVLGVSNSELQRLGKPTTLSDKSNYYEWLDKFESYLGLINSKFLDMLEVVRDNSAIPVRLADAAEEEAARVLYHVLGSVTSGIPNKLVRSIKDRNGLEAYRLIHNKYAGQDEQGETQLLQNILGFKFSDKMESLEGDILSFEELIAMYESIPESGEMISSKIKKGLLLRQLPEPLRSDILVSATKMKTYEELKIAVLSYLRLKLPPRTQQRGGDAMDVDWVNKGNGKNGKGNGKNGKGGAGQGKGGKNTLCRNCWRPNHTREQCYYNGAPGYPLQRPAADAPMPQRPVPKGKGKDGKGKGKEGKGKGVQVMDPLEPQGQPPAPAPGQDILFIDHIENGAAAAAEVHEPAPAAAAPARRRRNTGMQWMMMGIIMLFTIMAPPADGAMTNVIETTFNSICEIADENTLNAVSGDQHYEWILIDSGAFTSACPPSFCEHIPIKSSKPSRTMALCRACQRRRSRRGRCRRRDPAPSSRRCRRRSW